MLFLDMSIFLILPPLPLLLQGKSVLCVLKEDFKISE